MTSKTVATQARSGLWALGTIGLIAGAIGGLAEVAWVALIAPVTGGDPVLVARGVTETVFPGLGQGSWSVSAGLGIHFVLAAVLGIAVTVVLRHLWPGIAGRLTEMAAVTGVLALVWLMNFHVILPIVNPAFVGLLPLWASLISKLLFGLTAAVILRLATDRPKTGQTRRQ